MSRSNWQPSEEIPAYEGQPVPVWLCLSGDRIFPGTFVEHIDKMTGRGRHEWLGQSGRSYTASEVQYWQLRGPGGAVPEQPY